MLMRAALPLLPPWRERAHGKAFPQKDRDDFIRALDANMLTPIALMQAALPAVEAEGVTPLAQNRERRASASVGACSAVGGSSSPFLAPLRLRGARVTIVENTERATILSSSVLGVPCCLNSSSTLYCGCSLPRVRSERRVPPALLLPAPAPSV